MSESRRSLALVMLVATMVVWGSTFVITKAAAKDIAPMMLATLRFLTAAVVLLPYAWLKGNWRSLPKPMPWGALLGMALTGIATFTIAFNYALVYGSASQGALIYALVPAAVAVAAVVFLKERMSKRRIAGIVLSIVGVGLVALGGESDSSSPQPLLGAVWMIAAALSWAAYTIFAKRLAEVDQAVTIALVSLFGTLMLVPLAAIELSHAPWQAPSTQAWLSVIFLGVAASALAYIAYGYALRQPGRCIHQPGSPRRRAHRRPVSRREPALRPDAWRSDRAGRYVAGVDWRKLTRVGNFRAVLFVLRDMPIIKSWPDS